MSEKKYDNCADDWEMEREEELPLCSSEIGDMCNSIDMYFRLTIEDYQGFFPCMTENEMVIRFPELIQTFLLEKKQNILDDPISFNREGNLDEIATKINTQLEKVQLSITKLLDTQKELRKDKAALDT